MAVDPIHQFRIIDLVPIAKIGHVDIAFTNSAAYMFLVVAGLTIFLVGSTAGRRGRSLREAPASRRTARDSEPAMRKRLRSSFGRRPVGVRSRLSARD